MSRLESQYQAKLIQQLCQIFPGCFILKNDSGYLQGVPDLLVLFEDKWAMLEVKESTTAAEQPNQRYYVEKLDSMSFAAFIYPENEQDVLRDLQQVFYTQGFTRASER